MTAAPRNVLLVLIVLAVWTGITLFGALVIYGRDIKLDAIVSTGIAWHLIAACLLLIGVIAARGWSGLGFRSPEPGTLK